MKKLLLCLPVFALFACGENIKKVDLECGTVGDVSVMFDGDDLNIVSNGVKVKNSITVISKDGKSEEFQINNIVPDTELTSIIYMNNDIKFYLMQEKTGQDSYHFVLKTSDKLVSNDITCSIKK